MADRLKILYRIPELLERYRRGLAIASTLRVVWFLASTHLLVLGVLGWFSLRYPLTPGFLQVMSGSFLIYFGLPILFWIIYQNKNHSPLFIAEKLDHANSKAPDPFRTSLSLSNHGEDTLRKLDRLYGSILSTLQFPRPKFITKSNLVALGLSSVFLGVASIFSHHPVEFFRRVAMPWSVLKTLPLLKFDLDAPRVVLGEGDTAAVVGQVLNALPGQSVFAYVSIGASQSRIPLSIAEEGHFKFNFGPVTRNFSVRFAGENGHSPSFRFTVLPSPYLIGMQAILEPPSYSHLHKDTLPQGVSRFSILPGTRVTWTLKADRPLRSLQFLHSEEESDSKTKTSFISDSLGAGTQYLAVREILHPLNYRFLLEDENGIHSQPMLPNRIDLLSDRPPEVDLITPNSDTVFDRDAKLTLGFRVKDDFGISKLKLVYRILVDGKLQAQGQRDCGDWLKRTHAGLVDTVWNMAGLPLGAQSKVEFYLLAFDNDRVNGPKSGKSETRTLRMLSLHEVVAAARLRELSTESNLKQALEREKQLAKKLERDAQSTHDEGPPMLAEYEVNRIMVEDPQDHLRRTEAALGSLEQTVERQVSEHSQTSTKEMAKVKSGVKEFHEALKKSEPDMPKGNQGFLPMDQRQKNLENLLRSQKDQARRLDALREKMDKITNQSNPFDVPKARLEELSKELQKNIANQTDLQKQMEEQVSQAKAKSDLMDQAIQEQMSMAQDMKSASDDIHKDMEQGQKNGNLSPDLLDKMKKVDELMREVLPDSVRKMLEQKLQGQEVDQEELKKKLQDMLRKQAELSENLNRALAMLEQLRDKKRMQELRQALIELKSKEEALQKNLEAGQAGAQEEGDQKEIQREAQKAFSDFATQAAAKKALQEINKKLTPAAVQKDMQAVRDALAANAKNKSNPSSASTPSSASASKSASSAASKMGEMAEMLGEAMAGMDNSVDVGEAQDLLQESLALSRLQILIRGGSARRLAEGWESDEGVLYGNAAQTAQWLHERIKIIAAKIPFIGASLTTAARNLAQTTKEASQHYSWDLGEQALKHNQTLSRELLKLLKMAQSNGGQGSGSGSGSETGTGSGSPSSNPGGEGQGGSGDVSSQLQGMSGKQMAINQATYQLLRSMLEGRQPGQGKSGKGEQGQGKGQVQGQGQAQGAGQGAGQEEGQSGSGQPEGKNHGTLPGMANQQGELGEALETLAEKIGEEAGAAQKIRGLADQARKLEEELRQGTISPEELRQKQERFQSRLLEAASALEERGQSESRQAETRHDQGVNVADGKKAMDETRLIQLLREARRNAKEMTLSESQRKYLNEYYESMLTR